MVVLVSVCVLVVVSVVGSLMLVGWFLLVWLVGCCMLG